MAKSNPYPLLFLSSLLLSLISPTTAVTGSELDAAIAALRSSGYNLFGNAITTSDVRLELLFSNATYTFFAPTDASLFSLDMAASSADVYTTALRYHVALGRFPLSYLRSLPDRAAVRTLVPSRHILISRRGSADFTVVTADGLDVVFPGLFYGQDLSVHGLDGILPRNNRRISARAPNLAPRSPDPRISPTISPPPSLSPVISPDLSPTPSISPTSSLSPVVSPYSSPSPSISPTSSLSPVVSPYSSPSPSISPASSISPSISAAPGHSPSISPASGLSPSISPVSGHSPSFSSVSARSPSISSVSGHSPSFSSVSARSPSISSVSGHSPSFSPVSELSPSIFPVPSLLPSIPAVPSLSPSSSLVPSLSPSISLVQSLSPSMAPDSSFWPSIPPESGLSPSIAPESVLSQRGSANLRDFWSPASSPAVNAPSAALASSDAAMGFVCKEKAETGVNCLQSRSFGN